jgi:hypothetical protein
VAIAGWATLLLQTNLMLLDGLAIVGAGAVAGTGMPLVAFTAAIAVDRALTQATSSLAMLAAGSASSTRMRGRIQAAFALVVILGNMVVEGLATVVSEAIGILPMMVRVALLQVGLVLLLAAIGRRRLWRFGLFSSPASSPRRSPLPARRSPWRRPEPPRRHAPIVNTWP